MGQVQNLYIVGMVMLMSDKQHDELNYNNNGLRWGAIANRQLELFLHYDQLIASDYASGA